ncbi:MAG TPA: hypothetical protein V6D33_00015 [Cyanophyceae cyanobacterium]
MQSSLYQQAVSTQRQTPQGNGTPTPPVRIPVCSTNHGTDSMRGRYDSGRAIANSTGGNPLTEQDTTQSDRSSHS